MIRVFSGKIAVDFMFNIYVVLKSRGYSDVYIGEDPRIGLLLGIKSIKDRKLLMRYVAVEKERAEGYYDIYDTFIGLDTSNSIQENIKQIQKDISNEDRNNIIEYFSDLVLASKIITNGASKYITNEILRYVFQHDIVFEVAVALGLDIPELTKHSRNRDFRNCLIEIYNRYN